MKGGHEKTLGGFVMQMPWDLDYFKGFGMTKTMEYGLFWIVPRILHDLSPLNSLSLS